jgi:peptide methionine sulfoxide reductase msrA/msrB
MNKFLLWGMLSILLLGIGYGVVSNSGNTGPSVKKPIPKGDYRVAVFAGGCFWSLESYFEKIPDGIIDVQSGYSGGTTTNPTYQNYGSGDHREAVQVLYDPKKISYGQLTEYFFRHIDPTDAGGSFYDRGPNYTSAVYFQNPEEQKIAGDVIAAITAAKIFDTPIVTEVLPKSEFWPAEAYHQDYAKNNKLHYDGYRIGSGRDAFLKKTWDGKERPLYAA